MPRQAAVQEKPVVQTAEGVRPFEKTDVKTVEMLVGQGVMEGLARANKRTYISPFAITIWVAAASVLNYYLDFKPNDIHWLSYLSPAIGFGLCALPAMALIEYIHRGPFTARMREVLGAVDMVYPENYYSGSAGQMLVLQHESEVVGVLALDASPLAGTQLGSVLGEEEGKQGDDKASLKLRNTKTGQAKVVQIRHLDVDFPARRAGIAKELLLAGLDKAFAANEKIERTIVLANPFTPGGEALWHKLGFKKVQAESGWAQPRKMGLLGWTEEWWALSRGDWAATRQSIIDGK